MPKSKFVYFFGGGKAEGKANMKELLGGKGANLAEMANLGIPVPAGFWSCNFISISPFFCLIIIKNSLQAFRIALSRG